MALDTSRDYGTSCGGPTNGFAVQDGKIYNHDGDEVDKNGVPVKPASVAHKAPVAKKEPATPETARAIFADAENDPDADEKSEVQEASDWLRDRIGEAGGQMAKREIIHEAQQAGFAERTIQRAKKRAGVITRQTGFGAAKQSTWRLADSPIVPDKTVGTDGDVGTNDEPVSADEG